MAMRPAFRRGGFVFALLALLPDAQAAVSPVATIAQEGEFRPAIAVRRSGMRVESVDPAVGDSVLLTPFGSQYIPLDPVVEVVDGRIQLEGFRRLRELGRVDDLDLLRDLSTAGQLGELVAVARELHAGAPDLLAPYRALEAWGADIDPVPGDVDREERVAWLWKRAHDEDFATAVLAAARLNEEVLATKTAAAERRLTLREIRHGLEQEAAWTRRAAAQVAAAQFSNDIPLLLELCRCSMNDPVAPVRDGAAWAVREVRPDLALAVWVAVLCRSAETDLRVAASEGLARYCGEEGLRALFLVLSTTGHRAPGRFHYAGRDISVVNGGLRNVAELQYLKKWSFLMPSPDAKPLEAGSVLRVTTVGPDLEKQLLRILEVAVGSSGPPSEGGPRTTRSWLEWYAARVAVPED